MLESVKCENGKMTIVIAMAARPSSTGKTMGVATTGGNRSVMLNGQELKVGVNVYHPDANVDVSALGDALDGAEWSAVARTAAPMAPRVNPTAPAVRAKAVPLGRK